LKTIAILAPEPIRPRMAGMGIRALEIARALAGEFDVCLLVGNDPVEAREVAGSLEVVAAKEGALAEAARGAHAAVVSGHAANWWFHQVSDVPVAADLYDPFPVENLHYARALGKETAAHDRRSLALALAQLTLGLGAPFFGGLIASGWHTCAVAMRLMCDGYLVESSCVGSPGLDELRWLKPVRPGDSLRLRATVLEQTPSRTQPGRGTVKFRWEVLNQRDDVVCTMIGRQHYLRRTRAP
jgi:acyl dehydratase